jgi:hypothetical protein
MGGGRLPKNAPGGYGHFNQIPDSSETFRTLDII